MRITIEQTCKIDEDGLSRNHPNYIGWQEGAIQVYEVRTILRDKTTQKVCVDSLSGIAVADEDDEYLRTVKAEQLVNVFMKMGIDLEEVL